MQKYKHWGYILTLPFVVGFLVFQAYPFIYSIYLSFTSWDMFNPPRWIGLDNWRELFTNKAFGYSVRNIFYFAMIFVPLQTFLAIVSAYALNQGIRAKGLFRAIYFLPVITPWIAGGLLWKWLLDANFGLINLFLGYAGLGPFKFLTSPHWYIVIGSIAIANVWKGIGYSMVILLAGMQNISKDMYEAAEMDGARKKDVFFKIIIPLVSPMVYLTFILSTIAAFHAFDVFLVMMPAPGIVADQVMTANIMIYRDAFLNFRMGTATTMSWALFIIILAITLFQQKMEKRWVHYD